MRLLALLSLAAVAAAQRSDAPAPIGAGGGGPDAMYDMKWPVTGRATSRVGPRGSRFHAGRDIACSYVPVRAAYGGRVSRLGNDPNGYGLYIDVTHASGYMTRYAHLSRYGARLNQSVVLGQQIGVSGNTGNSTGPHLHFEVRRNGSVQRPYWDANIPLTTHRYTDFIPYDFPGLGGPTRAKLRGVLYDASRGTGARIAGATVSLSNGVFATTSSTGYFEFVLAAGKYTYAGTAAGFHAGSRSQTVPRTGEIWGSVGIRPGTVPRMTANPSPAVGASLGITVAGDVGSPVIAVIATRPQLPLIDLRSSGIGVLWPRVAGALTVRLGSIPTGGVLRSGLRAPASARGVRFHMQSVVRRGRAWRVTNGVGLRVR